MNIARTLVGYFGKRTVKSRLAEPRLSSVEDELVKTAHGFASDLLNGYEIILDVSVQLEVELGSPLQEWQKIKDDARSAVDEVRVRATKWATIIAGTISVVELSLAAPENAGFSQGLRSSAEILQKSYADARDLENKLAEILRCIRVFRQRWPEGTSVYNSGVQPMIVDAEALISRLVQPAPSQSADMANLLDNSSAPGVMEVLMTLLSGNTAMRVHELMEGKPIANIEAEKGDRSRIIRGARNPSALRCLLGVGYYLHKDLSVLADKLGSTHKHDWSPQVQRISLALYSILKQTLEVLVEDLEEGKVGRDAMTSPVKFSVARPFRFLRGVYSLVLSKVVIMTS